MVGSLAPYMVSESAEVIVIKEGNAQTRAANKANTKMDNISLLNRIIFPQFELGEY